MKDNLVRKSLLYPIAVLSLSGLSLLILPELTVELLGSDRPYPPELLRLLAMFILGLASFVSLTYQFKAAPFYMFTVIIRLGFALVLSILYLFYSNPLFLVILVVLLLGLSLTLLAYRFQTDEKEKFD